MYQVWLRYWNGENEDIVRPVTEAHENPWDAVREFDASCSCVGCSLFEVKTALVKTVIPGDDWHRVAKLRRQRSTQHKECVYRIIGHPGCREDQEWIGIPPLYAEGCGTKAEILRFE